MLGEPYQAVTDGSVGDLGYLGSFLMGHSIHVDVDGDGLGSFVQTIQELEDFMRARPFQPRGLRLRQTRVVRPTGGLVAQEVQTQIRGHSVEPTEKLSSRAQLIAMAKTTDEYLLGDVTGRFVVA
jgi:hypothetical protein